MAFFITTTGTLSPVVFDDIGGRSLTHPTVNLDLSLEFSITEIGESLDIQSAIDNGYITVTDSNGNPVVNASSPSIPASSIPWSFRKNYTKESDKPYVGTSKTSYKAVTTFMFPGTLSGGIPDSVKVGVSSKSNNGTVGIRILDISSNPPNVISENSSLAVLQDSPAIYVLPSPSNLPPGEAIFQVQIKKVTAKILLHEILIEES